MNRKQLWFSTFSCIVFALVVWVLFSVWSEGNDAAQWVEQTHKVIDDLNSISTTVQTVESDFRGYLSSGNVLYLQSSEKAKLKALERAQSLAMALSADRGQRARAFKLKELIQDKFEWERQVLAAYQQGGTGAMALTHTMQGMKAMDMVRAQMRELETNENAILSDRRAAYATYRTLLLTAASVLSAVGGIALWQAIRLDALSIRIESQRVQAYDRLEQLNQQLNKQVADLLSAQEETNKALKVRSEFLAKVSHELRTPLAGVIGATELTLRMPLLEEQRDLVATAKQCGESLLSVINDVLNFEQMESQEFHIQSSEFDLPEAVQSALEPLRMKANAKGLKFEVEISDRVPAMVFGDRLRIQQVLVNLVDNAIKFTDEGDVSILVGVLSGEGAGSTMVQFRVIDTGSGFALDQLPRIFEPFEQLETFMTRKHDGTGLGLPISNKLVNLMKGKMEVLSQPNQGSEFSFTLPVDSKVAASDVPEQVSAGAGMESTGCILVVDDNATMRKITQLQLKKLGYEVQLASSGEEAVEATSKQRYLLIIMDVQMQGIDGLEAAKIIRSSQDNPCRDIPIVALTAHAMPEDLERCLAAGMNDYVAKPATLQSIEAVISKWTAPAAKYSGDSLSMNLKRTS